MAGAGDVVGASPAHSTDPTKTTGGLVDGEHNPINQKLASKTVRPERGCNQLVSVCWPLVGHRVPLVTYYCKDSMMRIFGLSLTSIFVLFLVFVLGTKFPNALRGVPIVG